MKGPHGVWRTYAWWLASSTGQRYGGAVQALAVILITYWLTGSTVAAGALGTIRALLAMALVIPGGAVVDAHDRRRLMVVRGTLNATLWGGAAVLFACGAMTFPVFAALVVVDAVLDGLLGGAAEAALRSLVDAEGYARARAVNEGRDASAQLLGGPLAGALFSVCTFGPVLFGAVMDAASALTAWRLPGLPTGGAVRAGEGAGSGAGDDGAGTWTGVWSGLGWIVGRPAVLTLTLVTVLASFGGFLFMNVVQLHLVAQGVVAARVGVLSAAEAAGVLVGSPLAAWAVPRLRTGVVVVGSQLWSAVCLVPVILHGTYAVCVACCFAYAMFVPLINASAGGFIFQMVPQELQGRVGAANTLMVGLPVAGAAAAAGLLVEGTGLAVSAGIAALVIAAGAVLALLAGDVRAIPAPRDWRNAS